MKRSSFSNANFFISSSMSTVANLREQCNKDGPVETPVTQGWWGKPECLPQAKFDFLCVTANLFASQEPNNKANISKLLCMLFCIYINCNADKIIHSKLLNHTLRWASVNYLFIYNCFYTDKTILELVNKRIKPILVSCSIIERISSHCY